MSRPPRVAMLVDNDVEHDTRVRKSAATAAAAGCEVLVVGLSSTARRSVTRLGPVRVVRVPLLEGAGRLARLMARGGYRSDEEHRDAVRSGAASTVARARRRAGEGSLIALSRRALAERLPLPGARRHIDAYFVQMARSMAPVVAEFVPDVIHAHDFPALEAAGRAHAALRRRGGDVRLIYDAHEYVRGLTTFSATRHRAYMQLEARHIHAADRVVTVSPTTAELLEREYDLRRRPDVVLNAPLMSARRSSSPGVRAALGLPAATPLLVYAGIVKPARGLAAVVEALPLLEGVHLALVTADRGRHVDELQELARRAGCADRLHVVAYVPPDQVSDFLADATIGVNALLRYGNAQATLPNKLFEYMHAGLPTVASDNEATRAVVEGLGIGETFRAGDAADFARAARAVLADPARYRARLSDPHLLHRHAWESQAEVLVELYASLLPGSAGLAPPDPEHIARIARG
jgi:glycogen synthase